MKFLILVLLLLVSCGTDDGGGSANLVDAQTSKKDDKNKLQSLYVANADKLPSCSDENDSQLAYAKQEDAFFVCNAGNWDEITIDGDQGEKGEKGDDGEQGDAGMAVDNTWEDPITGYTWLIGSNAVWATANSACSGSWSLGTRAEVLAAALHGLGVASDNLGGPDNTWTIESTGTGTYYSIITLQASPTSESTGGPTVTLRGSICVKK